MHGQLPNSMIITEDLEVSNRIFASGGFADIRSGRYMGHSVAVKTLRVSMQDDLLKIRKVSINHIFSANRSTSRTALFQQFCRGHSLEYAVPPERLETCWYSVEHGEKTIFHGVGADGECGRHEVHQKQSPQ